MKIRYRLTTVISVLLSLFLTGGYVSAADRPVSLSIDKRTVVLGDSCTLTIKSDDELAQVPAVPNTDDLMVQYIGAQQESFASFQLVINGRQVRSNAKGGSVNYIYKIIPNKAGTLTVPSFDVVLKDKTFKTNQFTIDVTDQAPPSNNVFIVQEFDKHEVFLGDKVQYRFKWYFDMDVQGYECTIPWLAQLKNFVVQDPPLDPNKQYQRLIINGTQEVAADKTTEVVNGKQYAVVTFDKILIPMVAGDYDLGTTFLKCDVVTGYQQQRSRGFIDDFFASDFDHFFGMGRNAITEPIIARSEPFTMTVKDVPDASRPADFTGGIGTFAFKMQLSSTTVKEGEPVTVTMAVAGDGNIEQVTMPAFPEIQGIKSYEPESKMTRATVNGADVPAKVFEKIIIPTLEGSYEIPQVSFSYFDTAAGAYKTLRQGPFTLTVTKGDKQEQDVHVIAVQDQSVLGGDQKEIQVIKQDIHFIKTHIGEMRSIVAPWYRNVWILAALLGVPVVVTVCVFVLQRRRDRLETDSVFAREQRAFRSAQKGLAAVEKRVAEQGREFYYDLTRVLNTYLSAKLALSEGSGSDELLAALQRTSVGEPVAQELRALYERFDSIKFGISGTTDERAERHDLLKRVTACVRHIEKELR